MFRSFPGKFGTANGPYGSGKQRSSRRLNGVFDQYTAYGKDKHEIQRWRTGVGLDEDEQAVRTWLHNIVRVTYAGGGARGLVYDGIYWAMQELGLDIPQLIGSSIGGVTALLAAMGLTEEQAEEELNKAPFENFFDERESKVTKVWRFWRSGGLHSHDPMLAWISALLEKYCGNKEITFAEFVGSVNKVTGKRCKDVAMTTTQFEIKDEGTNKASTIAAHTLLLSARSTPALRIVDAVQMTTALPGAYGAVHATMRADGSLDRGNPQYTYADGGLLANNPADVLMHYDAKGQLVPDEALFKHQTSVARQTLSIVLGEAPGHDKKSVHLESDSAKTVNSIRRRKATLAEMIITWAKNVGAKELPAAMREHTITVIPPKDLETMTAPTRPERQKAYVAGYDAFWKFIEDAVERERKKQQQRAGLRAQIQEVAAILQQAAASMPDAGEIRYLPIYKTEHGQTVFTGFQLKFTYLPDEKLRTALNQKINRIAGVIKPDSYPTAKHPWVVHVETSVDWEQVLPLEMPDRLWGSAVIVEGARVDDMQEGSVGSSSTASGSSRSTFEITEDPAAIQQDCWGPAFAAVKGFTRSRSDSVASVLKATLGAAKPIFGTRRETTRLRSGTRGSAT